MARDAELFDEAIARIDAANAADPNREFDSGQEHPKELLYARRMTAWLRRVAPDAGLELRIAVRAQHLCRWAIPRSDYPAGRAGYLRWRAVLGRLHADKAGAILRDVGFDADSVARVQALIRKDRLNARERDPDVQALEDTACLVFLEHYLPHFAAQHAEASVVEIIRKTLRKMSPRAQALAVEVELPPESKELVRRALRGEDEK